MTWQIVALAALIPLTACSGMGENRPASVVGELTYSERIALPPDAQAEVALRAATFSTSATDPAGGSIFRGPGDVIAQKRIQITHAIPIPFQLDYNLNAVDPTRNLVVDAWIYAGDEVLFAVTEASQIPAGSDANVQLTLRRPRHVTFACADGSRLAVAFPMMGELAFLEANGDTPVPLRAQPVASGFYYAGEGYGLRGRGLEALLRRPSSSETRCEAQISETAR